MPSELNAAYLWGELEAAEIIYEDRMRSWDTYWTQLSPLAGKGCIELPVIPEHCVHNAHMFYIKTRDLEERTKLIQHLKEHKIGAVFHYIPLHSSEAGKRFGRFHGEDRYTTRESERLLRLPMYYGLNPDEIEKITECVKQFYK